MGQFLSTGRLDQLFSTRYRCGRYGVQFPGRSNRHSAANGSPSMQVFFFVLRRRQAAEMGPATCYPLQRNTSNMMKILWFYLSYIILENFTFPRHRFSCHHQQCKPGSTKPKYAGQLVMTASLMLSKRPILLWFYFFFSAIYVPYLLYLISNRHFTPGITRKRVTSSRAHLRICERTNRLIEGL